MVISDYKEVEVIIYRKIFISLDRVLLLICWFVDICVGFSFNLVLGIVWYLI